MQFSWNSYRDLDDRFRLDRIFPAFETEDGALREDKLRQMSLLRASLGGDLDLYMPPAKLKPLIERLGRSLSNGRHVSSFASSFAMRSLRRSFSGALLEEFDGIPDSKLMTFTVLKAKWVLKPEELLLRSASWFKDDFSRDLRRAGVDGPLTFALHSTFEPNEGVFANHYHGAGLSAEYENLMSMSGKWGYELTASGAPPIRCDPVRDRVKQFSYLLKSYWPEREISVDDGRANRSRIDVRVREPFHSIYRQGAGGYQRIEIINVGGKPVTVTGLVVNDRPDCRIARLDQITIPNPSFDPALLQIGEGNTWFTPCRVVRVAVSTSQGMASYEFK